MRIKKIFLTVLLLMLIQISVHGSNEIGVYIDGAKIKFDSEPQIINGSTLVPMRKIFETLGAHVEWIPESKTVIATKGEKLLKLQIDNYTMVFQNNNIKLNVSPRLINGYTYVPLRAVSEIFDAKVNWGEKNRIVTISTNGTPVYPDFYNVPDFGKIFDIQLIRFSENTITPGLCAYMYDWNEVYEFSENNPDKINSLDNIMMTYGFQRATQRPEVPYAEISQLYLNPNNPDYAVRFVWCVTSNEQEITMVEIEPTRKLFFDPNIVMSVPLTELEYWKSSGWMTIDEGLNKEYWVHKRAMEAFTGKKFALYDTFSKVKVCGISKTSNVENNPFIKHIDTIYVEYNGGTYECDISVLSGSIYRKIGYDSSESISKSLNDAFYDTPPILDVNPKEYYAFNNKEWENVQKGFATIGLTEKEVLAIKGAPDDKNTTTGNFGTIEQYVYRKSKYSNDYYYFTNGILTEYQH